MTGLKRIAAVLLTVVIAAGSSLSLTAEASNVVNRAYAAKYNLTVNMLKNDEKTMTAIKEFGRSVVFFSVSDGKSKAKVFLAQSYTLDTALSKAYEKAKGSGVVPKWFKLDIVISDEEKSYKDFVSETAGKRGNGMRNGIAFNDYYGTALLEAQLNSSGIIDYETGKLSLKKVNTELSAMGKKKINSLPSKLYLFKTQGYFAENTAYASKLTSGYYGDTGRRKLENDRSTSEMLADRASEYLSSIIDKNGKFIYGYYPIDNEELEGYNILRHAGTTWNLILQYDMCRDESLVPVIKSAIGYLKKSIQYKDSKTAFVVDGSRLNVGGGGIALLVLTTYEEVFGTTEYNSLIRALANGVMYMQKKDGSYVHTLHKSNYKLAEDYIIIYYDGEAAFGMLKAYGVIGDKTYLDAAAKAANYFIKKNLESEHSHWMSYVFNELTKYLPEEKYFEFGLKNVDTDNYSTNMANIKAGVNSVSETLNASFELYDRLVKGGYKCDDLKTFDADALVRAVQKRAEYGLNYFMFPEYAMYFKAPDTVLNSFSVREDAFRIRIDDIQHFMGGYYMFWKNWDRIMYYKENPYVPEDTDTSDEEELLIEAADDEEEEDGTGETGEGTGDAAENAEAGASEASDNAEEKSA